MKGNPNAKAMAVLAIHGVWAFLLSLWNDFFALGPIYFYLCGAFAILPAIRLDFNRGFFCAVASGCLLDAASPSPFGFHACGLAIAQIALRSANDRTLFSRRPTLILSTLIINMLFFLFLHLWFSAQIAGNGEILLSRAFTDLIFSQLLLAVTLPWLIQLNDDFFDLVGIKTSDEKVSTS